VTAGFICRPPADLTNLPELVLSSTKVTDAGLERRKTLTGLPTLSLHETQVGDEDLETLQQVLPQCKVEH